jgi:hypothetical protein
MTDTNKLLDELISEGEKILSGTVPSSPEIGDPTPSIKSASPPADTTPSSPTNTDGKFDKLYVLLVIVCVAIFAAYRFIFEKMFMVKDQFGDEVFSTKRYIGVSGLTCLVVCGLVIAVKKYNLIGRLKSLVGK